MRVAKLKQVLGVLGAGLTSRTSALATFSPGPSYAVGIPSSSTISQSSEGGIYFQLSAPTSYQWVGLGIGEQMAGATIFVMYADGQGNVTISARDGNQGHVEPVQDPTLQSGVTLLAGSGIVDGNMVANVYCTTCKLLSSKTSTTSPWICAWNQGSALDSQSTSATITQHQITNMRQFEFDLTAAVLSSDSNPFTSSSAATGSSPSQTAAGSSPSSTGNSRSGSSTAIVVGTSAKVIIDYYTAHGIIMAVVVVLLLPFGAIFRRLGGGVYAHGIWQVLALCAMLCGFGLGIRLAQMRALLYNTTHTIFGTVIVCLFLVQPFLGLIHHLQYRRTGSRSPVSHLHIWYGRALIVCGVINGGLGLRLADNAPKCLVAYAVLAGVVGVAYVGIVVLGLGREKGVGFGRGLGREKNEREGSGGSP